MSDDEINKAVREAAAENREEVVFWLRVQYLFYKQLKALKAYCEKKGIRETTRRAVNKLIPKSRTQI